ncbi:MAG: hypothetical protein ACRDHE_05940, partial [Ktedonobacterales bacterium]
MTPRTFGAAACSVMYQRPALRRYRPLKGLTDNPAYQWWRDPTILQSDSVWGASHTADSLNEHAAEMRSLG